MKKSILGLLALAVVACGDDDSMEISDSTLSGTLAGSSWSFVAGNATAGPNGLTIRLAGYEEEDPCGFSVFRDDPTIWWFASDEPTEQELRLGDTVVFQVPEDGDSISANITDGRYVIDQVGPDTVSGGLVASGFGDSVNGRWEVPLCD